MAHKSNYDMSKKVSQKTIDDMKTMGMDKAIERANSGTAGAEFEEGARRMYGKRIKSRPKPSQNVQKPQDRSHVQGEAAAKPLEGAETGKPSRVYKEPKPTINARFRKAVLGKSEKVKLF